MTVVEPLPTVHALAAGFFGGGCVVLAQLTHVVDRREWPWKDAGIYMYITASTARLLLGGGMSAVLAYAGQISGIAGAVIAGVSAPIIVARMLAATTIGRTVTAAGTAEIGTVEIPTQVDGVARPVNDRGGTR